MYDFFFNALSPSHLGITVIKSYYFLLDGSISIIFSLLSVNTVSPPPPSPTAEPWSAIHSLINK